MWRQNAGLRSWASKRNMLTFIRYTLKQTASTWMNSALYKFDWWIGCVPFGLLSVASRAGFTPATPAQTYPASKLENCDKAKHFNHWCWFIELGSAVKPLGLPLKKWLWHSGAGSLRGLRGGKWNDGKGTQEALERFLLGVKSVLLHNLSPAAKCAFQQFKMN